MADDSERKTLSLKPGKPREADPSRESVRTGARAHRVARDRAASPDAAPKKNASRGPRDDNDRGARGPRPEGGFRPRPEGDRPFNRGPRDDNDRGPRDPRSEGGFRPRPDSDRPFNRGPRDDGDRGPRGPRPEGGFRPRPDSDRPFNRGPRDDGDRGPRGPRPEGGFRPRPDGDRPFNRGPRDDNDRGPRGPRPEGGFRPRPEGDRPFNRGPRDQNDRGPRGPRPEGGFRPRPEGDRPFNRGPRDDNDRGPRGPRPEGGFRPRGDDSRPFNRGPRDDNDRGPRGPRPEGGFRPRGDDSRPFNRGPRDDNDRGPRGPRPEGGFRPRGDDSRPFNRGPRDDNDRGPRGPRPEGGFRPRGDDSRPFNRGPRDDNDRGPRGPRPDGGFRPRGDDNRPFNRGPRDDNDRGPRGPRSEGGFRPRAPRDDAPGERPTPRHATTPADIYPVFAPCPQGLEAALADELTQLGLTDVQPGRSGVRFRASWLDVMRANLHSRLATRILVQVAHGPIETEDDLLRLAYDTPWERWFGAEQTLRVDTSAIRSPMQSLQYCNLRAKDGICDRLRDREGERPDIDTVRPDARVHVFLDETTATLYLDTSGESLFKRGWRFDKGEAPLRENLAAGLLALSGWKGDTPLVDPFCGSGTILIEAAFIALGVPPGMSRPFSFERLRNHDERVWHSLKADAQRQIRTKIEVPLVGSDIDPRAIDAARQNAERARLGPDTIQFSVAHARDVRPPSDVPGWIVTNPPYGERLETDEDGLWSEWASSLKAHFDGWQVHVITTDRGLPGLLRLNAQRRTPLYNGALECRLFAFEIVGGSYRQKL